MAKRNRPQLIISDVDSNQQSFDAGDTTFRNGDIAINKDGLRFGDDVFNDLTENDIEVIKIIGRGCSSYVQKVRHRETGDFLALKVINLYDKSKREQLMSEIKTLYHSDCSSLTRFYGAFYKDGNISVALEYMDLGSLDQVIEKTGRVPERVLAGMTYQILWGLSYLKYEKHCHRDIKPQNILVNTDGVVKLTDFGISKELESTMAMASTFVGTFKYMAPERIQSQPYSYPSDIWSLGLVLVECATGEYPFPEARTHIDMVQTVLDVVEEDIVPSPDAGFSEEFRELVASCVKKDPDDRLPPDILLGSPWLVDNGVSNIETASQIVAKWVNSGVMDRGGEGKQGGED